MKMMNFLNENDEEYEEYIVSAENLQDFFEKLQLQILKEEKEDLISHYPIQDPHVTIERLKKKCECGADKCNISIHSDYCPKYNK